MRVLLHLLYETELADVGRKGDKTLHLGRLAVGEIHQGLGHAHKAAGEHAGVAVGRQDGAVHGHDALQDELVLALRSLHNGRDVLVEADDAGEIAGIVDVGAGVDAVAVPDAVGRELVLGLDGLAVVPDLGGVLA